MERGNLDRAGDAENGIRGPRACSNFFKNSWRSRRGVDGYEEFHLGSCSLRHETIHSFESSWQVDSDNPRVV
jgi:hypothetical protein